MRMSGLAVYALLLAAIPGGRGFAQYSANDLFQFSRYWQQEPMDETSYDLNLDPGVPIEEKDLLLLIKELRAELPTPTPTPPLEEITITLSGLPEDATPLILVHIPAGSFSMGRNADETVGDSDELPQHPVTLTKDFYLAKYELTQAQWEAVMGTAPWTGYPNILDDPNSPAVRMSWYDAQTFIEAMNEQGQGTFRLPTEAEWEYACRAGSQTRFYWGDDPDYRVLRDHAWYYNTTYFTNEKYAHIVGRKLPNAWGLFDVIGNVNEWCQDWYASNYPADAVIDPTGPETGTDKVARGSSWGSSDMDCRSAYRNGANPSNGSSYCGIRLVRNP